MIDIFARCSVINKLLNEDRVSNARSEVIKLLDELDSNPNIVNPYGELLNHLIRKVGLLPYIDIKNAIWEDRFAYEAFKTDIGEKEKCVLHTAQSQVLKKLLKGNSLAVSAPTSFGKSFIIDAFIAIKQPQNIVIIVPTIALADETRRRLYSKFSNNYKIITTTDAVISEKNIFVFPQERAFAYIDKIDTIDILIVDEFYKASSDFDDERSSVLLSSIIELGKKAKQRYFLAPNIHSLATNVFTEGMQFLPIDFKTVVTFAERSYEQKSKQEKKVEFKKRMLRRLVKRKQIGKTLIYAGSYNGINDVSDFFINEVSPKQSGLLIDFVDWLKSNYGSEYSLINLTKRGVGIHNGHLHRSLGQIQVKLFEEPNGLDYLISTSSIIEGVNTQAKNVILWSNKNGTNKIDYFTYRNIIGRAGRMFRYFVGHVYILEEPPARKETNLQLQFTDDVIKKLDGCNPGIALENEQYAKIKAYNDAMEELLGSAVWSKIKNMPLIKTCRPSLLTAIVEKIKMNPEWPKNYSLLITNSPFDWRDALLDILRVLDFNRYKQLCIYVCKSSESWRTSVKDIYNQVKRYGITYEDMFTYERYMTFNLSSAIAVIDIIRQEIYSNQVSIASFAHKISNAFLPKLVFQLEEYGLPRMISKKMHKAHIVNLENDSEEISVVIKKLNDMGYENIVNKIPNLEPFDIYVLKHFMNGISIRK